MDSAKGQAPEAVPGIANWHGPKQANSSAAKLQPLNFFVVLHLPTGAGRTYSVFPMFSVLHDSVLFFQKAFGKTMHFSL